VEPSPDDLEYRCCFGCGTETVMPAPWSGAPFGEVARLARPGRVHPCRRACEDDVRIFFRLDPAPPFRLLIVARGQDFTLEAAPDCEPDLSPLPPALQPRVAAIVRYLLELTRAV
jgi:hypothetical protein